MKKSFIIFLLGLFFFAVDSVFADVTLGADDKVSVTRNVVDVTNPVKNTFTYSVEADASNPGTVTGLTDSFTIVFDGTENVATNTATKTGYVSFNGATFSEVGDYTFKVKETASTDATTYPVATDEYYVYVSVRYDTDAMDGTMVATVLAQGKLNGEGEKTDLVYPSNSRFTNIKIKQTVSGDLADVDKYFTVKVTVNGNEGDTYKVTGGSNDSNPTTVTAGTEATFLLKHGEEIVIGQDGDLNQVLIGATYTVTQVEEENYTTTIDDETVLTTTKTTVVSPASNETEINDDYRSNPLTGLVLNVLPFVIIIAISVVGIVLFSRKRTN